jgi:hypothetical protein
MDEEQSSLIPALGPKIALSDNGPADNTPNRKSNGTSMYVRSKSVGTPPMARSSPFSEKFAPMLKLKSPATGKTRLIPTFIPTSRVVFTTAPTPMGDRFIPVLSSRIGRSGPLEE